MATKIDRVVWDSCVIIDAIQATPGRWEKIEPFLKLAESTELGTPRKGKSNKKRSGNKKGCRRCRSHSR